jgi:crotonobetainyl-CoA:carnitine CoA-transferase CaiB-like acyl-CoA transferase
MPDRSPDNAPAPAAPAGALAGLDVILYAPGVAASYAGKLLADLGADVTRLEHPDGDPLRRHGPYAGDVATPDGGLLFQFLATGTRSVAFDFDAPGAAQALRRRIAEADVFLCGGTPAGLRARGVTFDALQPANARLVGVYVTPFGLTGPDRDQAGGELVAFHRSALGATTPAGSADPLRPPLKPAGSHALLVAGLAAAVATLHGLAARDATGHGQCVDVAELEPITSFQFMNMARWVYAGDPGGRGRESARERVDCRDGAVALLLSQEHQWQALVQLMGNPAWAADARFATRRERAHHAAELWALVGDWARGQPVDDVYRRGQALRVPVFPLNTVATAVDSAQVRARGFVAPLTTASGRTLAMPSAPYRFSRTPVRIRRAPACGEHGGGPRLPPRQAPRPAAAPPRAGANARLPLSGIRVADFSWVLAGPRCTEWLGAMGAEVVKVEGPRRSDPYRANPIHAPGHTDLESSGAFHTLNYSKLGCCIDLADPRGRDLARRLVAASDVVVENFAVGVMERFGLGYEALRQVRPDIVMVSSSAMGSTGPDRAHVAYGTLIHAFAGLDSVIGYPGDDFAGIGGTFTDPLTGAWMALATLAALRHRQHTGEGQLVDVSMVEATLMQLADAVLDYTANGRVARPRGNEEPGCAPHDCYPCAGDDRWVAIAVTDDDGWQRLRTALGEPAWTRDARFATAADRFRHRRDLDAQLAAWTRTLTPEAASARLQAAGVAACPCRTAREMYADAQLNARGFFVHLEHPVVGRRPVMRLPWLLDPGPNGRYTAAPMLGQHNEAVFGGILGLDAHEIAALARAGVITP